MPAMAGISRADKWLSVVTNFNRPDAEDGNVCPVSAETTRQVELDMSRTFAGMLTGNESSSEEDVVQTREKVTHLLIQWLQTQKELAYVQGMNHMMATCFREMKEEVAALQLFDFMLRQANINLYHIDVEKSVIANDQLSQMLWASIRQDSPEVAKRLEGMDIDFLPMIVQTWLTDLLSNALPLNAAARLWDHILECPGIPVKFAAQLLLSGERAILDCEEDELPAVLLDLPSRVQSPEDVDTLLTSKFADEQPPSKLRLLSEKGDLIANIAPVEPAEEPVETLLLKPKTRVKMPRRWLPWKFVSVAMAIPWLLTHATQPKEGSFSKLAHPPILRRASVPAVVQVLPMHEAYWPN
mmetsp:Transcript_18122/g.42428  ORF Transcript_18122/g.42428 Transcript_18122/m.42428 type:complete len:355 (-) Transcript_18122:138-1202(-)